MKKSKKIAISIMALVLGLALGSGVAYAGYSESDWWDTGYLNGINYTQCASMETGRNASGGYALATTWQRPTNKAASRMTIGCRAWLCYPSGASFKASGWRWNTVDTPAGKWIAQACVAENCRIGSEWVSWGRTIHWNGSSFSEWNTWPTAAVSVR